MKEAMDHTTCSALLSGYVAGKLEPRAAAAVAAHLGDCSGCSAELRALATMSATANDRLSARERSTLRARVAAAVGRAESLEQRRPERRRWRARLAPALGAAALVALVAVGAATVLTGGVGTGGSDAGGVEEAGGGSAASDRPLESAGGPARPDPGSASLPRFVDSGELNQDDLGRLGKEAAARLPLNRSLVNPRGPRRPLDVLAGRAPSQAVAEQLRLCTGQVRPLGRLVPVLGATATVEGERALVVVYANERRFEAWAWPEGSCGAPLARRAGARVEP
ncbi:MAG: zf-HC2 domain-containing protein [Actinomycetota bacterium]